MSVQMFEQMSEQRIFEDLSTFFDDVPDVVRAEISLLLVVLTDDHAVETEGWADCERTARPLFNASGRFGRFGDLIKAAAVFDVYFAADARERLAPVSTDQRYAERLAAIEQARRDWQILRQTSLSSAAISAALLPQFSPREKQISRGKLSGSGQSISR